MSPSAEAAAEAASEVSTIALLVVVVWAYHRHSPEKEIAWQLLESFSVKLQSVLGEESLPLLGT